MQRAYVFESLPSLPQEQTVLQALQEHVFKDGDGKLLGLRVHRCHALKFLADEPNRKTYELRSRPVLFLKEGMCVALISLNRNGGRTRGPVDVQCELLGILEFQGNVKVKWSSLSKFQALHQTTEEEMEILLEGKQRPEWLWAWHFELVKAFKDPPPIWCAQGAVVWHYFLPDAVSVHNPMSLHTQDKL